MAERPWRMRSRRWAAWGAVGALVAASLYLVVGLVSPDAAVAKAAGPAGWAVRPHRAQPLDLTDDQIQRIDQIRQRATEQAIPVQTELFSVRQQLALLLRSAQVDANRAKDLLTRLNELQGQLQQIWLQAELDARGVLTDEQRSRLGGALLWGPGGRMFRAPGFGPGMWGGHMMGMPGHMRFPGWRR